MKFDPVEFKIRGYLRKGSEILAGRDFSINIKRHERAHYIGMSAITACGRLIWMSFHRPGMLKYNVDQRAFEGGRIFDYGHIVEDYTLQALQCSGAIVKDTQTKFSDFDGKFAGHCDCSIDDLHIAEIKSMNQASFDRFQSGGTANEFWGYYVQSNLYVHYGKFEDSVLIASNKNRGQMDCERIKFDYSVVDFHRSKAENIITAPSIWKISPEYIEQNIDRCTFCPLRKICHGY